MAVVWTKAPFSWGMAGCLEILLNIKCDKSNITTYLYSIWTEISAKYERQLHKFDLGSNILSYIGSTIIITMATLHLCAMLVDFHQAGSSFWELSLLNRLQRNFNASWQINHGRFCGITLKFRNIGPTAGFCFLHDTLSLSCFASADIFAAI